MAFVIGIDAGSSATKIMGMNKDKHLYLPPLRTDAANDAGFFSAALDKYLDRSGVLREDVSLVALTGGRADAAGADMGGIPIGRVNEFDAMAAGALEFSGQNRGVVANIGTGACFVYAEKGKPAVHIGGSGIGGGTLIGLCSHLAYFDRIDDITLAAETGDLSKVDISIADMSLGDLKSLDPKMTLSNFGKTGAGATRSDLALGAINLVLQSVGTLALFACRAENCDTVIVSGGLAELPQAKENFENFEKIYGRRFIRCGLPAFVTAAGTILCS
jgi:type II pantothenate kinase